MYNNIIITYTRLKHFNPLDFLVYLKYSKPRKPTRFFICYLNNAGQTKKVSGYPVSVKI